MKGGCAAMMQAFIRLKDEDPGSRVMLQLVPDEETGGRMGTRFLVEQGYIGDFVICTEPTNLQISIQTKGIILLDIISAGKAAHGSRPWEGENAILKSLENFVGITALPILNIGSDFYEKSSVNLARIHGGDIYNRVPDSCVMGLDIRYVPHLDPEEIIARIREAVDGEVQVKICEHGVNVDPADPYVQRLRESVERIMPDETVELSAQHGGADTRFFAARGIPAVEFGPRGAFWHGDGEYVEAESLKQLEDILVDFALHF
jgi:succinyl-diaminopimelate desuccinylase